MSQRNNRIVMINNIPSPYYVDLCRTLQAKYPMYEFHFVFTSAAEGNRSWKAETEGLDHASILSSRVIRLKTRHDQRYIHFPGNIKKTLNEIDPAIVVAKEYNPAALSSLSWCRKKKRPYIHVTEGTLINEQNLNPIQKYSRRRIIHGADYCIAASTKAKEKLRYWNCPEEKIGVSYLTFDWEKLKKTERTPVPGRLLYVGSFAKRKGVDLLIQAVARLSVPYELHIVGNGTAEEESALKKQAALLGVSGKIRWCGYLEGEALYREYAEASAFVLATREDCFGLVLLEAAIKGVPIVSSCYADGAYDIVEQNVNGLIADPYDADSFAKAIENVLTDPDYQRRAAEKDLSAFALENTTEIYGTALARLLDGAGVLF